MSIEYTLYFIPWAAWKAFVCVIYRWLSAWKILKWAHTVIMSLQGTENPIFIIFYISFIPI